MEQQQQQEEDDHESDEDYQPTPTPTEMMLAKLLAKMELMETENATLKASLVPSASVAPPPPPVVVEDPEMVALQLKNKEMMDMLAAARAKPAESPAKKALRLENEALQRQVAMLMNGGGGGVPMVVGNNDDEDSVGSDISGSSVGSVSSTTHLIFTGQVAHVHRKGWFRVCKRDEYGVTLYTLRSDNTIKPLSAPQYKTMKPNAGECPFH
jgi:hypothetical protein